MMAARFKRNEHGGSAHVNPTLTGIFERVPLGVQLAIRVVVSFGNNNPVFHDNRAHKRVWVCVAFSEFRKLYCAFHTFCVSHVFILTDVRNTVTIQRRCFCKRIAHHAITIPHSL